MRKYLFLTAGLAAAFASPVQAADWYLVGQSDDDLFFADAGSVAKSGTYMQVNVLDSMGEPIDDPAGDIYYLAGPIRLDCSGRKYQNLGNAALGLDHSYLADADVDSDWQAVNPGTHAEAIFDFACDAGFRDTPVTDPFAYADEYWDYGTSDDAPAEGPVIS
ncbi:MAG: hypothetical protein J7496_15210 [Novosphingobium sp.]|nr:hypothetical protein [Novosphingobium sp.]MBO9603850.1 hypothetical protein [Novosphingobium sp.]